MRQLSPPSGLDFSSNDYLGLAASPRIAHALQAAMARGVPLGSGGSRLLRGNHAAHEELEHTAARWAGAQAALFFANGFAANTALLATLPQRGDLILYDALIHASVHDGMALTRGERCAFFHNDVTAADDALTIWRRQGGKGRPWIVIESLYSMDGDRAPLADFVTISRRHDAMLLIDEAHATGVYGAHGAGLADGLDGAENIITLRTCGKAMGCEGALVFLSAALRDFLINRARPFIFSTAPSPLMAAAVQESIAMLRDEPWRREELAALVRHAAPRLAAFGAGSSDSQIIPLILGDEARTMAAAQALQQQGFDVRGIRPPTVPPGTARLRISLTLNISRDDIDALCAALSGIFR